MKNDKDTRREKRVYYANATIWEEKNNSGRDSIIGGECSYKVPFAKITGYQYHNSKMKLR
jgi:hypothetical protein